MFIVGSRENAQALIDEAGYVRGNVLGGDGPWAVPRMDGRFRSSPLAGLGSFNASHLWGWSDGESQYRWDAPTLPVEQSLYNNIFNLPDYPSLPDEGDFNFYSENLIFEGGTIDQTMVLAVTDIRLASDGIQAKYRPLVVQQSFPSYWFTVIETKLDCQPGG